MTREQRFQTSFSSQLVTYSSWHYLPLYDEKKLPIGAFPAFSLNLGRTKFTSFDPTGKAIFGEQEFSIIISYLIPHIGDDALAVHSDIANLIEQFINVPIYATPGISPGETYCINKCEIIEVKAPAIQFESSRFQVVASGKFLFTLF
ncbi:MAG: hypothetical protein WCH46_07100 [bacterium]